VAISAPRFPLGIAIRKSILLTGFSYVLLVAREVYFQCNQKLSLMQDRKNVFDATPKKLLNATHRISPIVFDRELKKGYIF
jgi:hypothetical protein